MTDRKTETVHVGDVEFDHGFNESFEYYSHIDERKWNWQLWRHLQGQGKIPNTWYASVSTLSRTGGQRMLNTGLGDGAGGYKQKDPLYDLPNDPEKLLAALVGLIKRGEWPKDRPL